jgi:long-chain acyl-CoA synthetase
MSGQTAQTSSLPQGRHIAQIFFQRAEELGDRTFLKFQNGERFEDISWRDFAATVQSLALALGGIGLAREHKIAIIGENCMQWLAADLATLAGGWVSVVASPSLSDTMLARILGHSECQAAFVQDTVGVGRLLNLKGQLPKLTHIFVMQESDTIVPGTVSFAQLVARGRRRDSQELEAIIESVHPDSLATIMYTSGSTGEPKGVMRTQDNLLANITNGGELALSKPEELSVIVLSLNHLFGRFGFFKSVVTGRTTAIVEATELKLNLKIIESLGATSMAIVPRVMMHIWNRILDREENRQRWQQLEQLDRKRTLGGQFADAGESHRFGDLRTNLAEATRRALGGRIKYITYGAALMPPTILRFFELVGIPLIGSYGSTECGGVTLCGIGENRPGSLGKPFANVEIRIADDGEILVRGPTVTPGYFKDPDATREALEPDGWFHTGDLGALDPDGSLRITGRKKDVFNCADGSHTYPSFIELHLENESFIKQAILVGDRRPFIAALVVPDRDKVASVLKRPVRDLSIAELKNAVWSQIERLNGRLESYERISQIALIEHDFPAEMRSVNPLLKIKIDRVAVAARYRKEIEDIYALATEGDRF